MRKKALMAAVLGMSLAACSSAPKPKDLLLKGLQKNSELSSMTMEGTVNIKLSAEGLDLEIPADMTVIADKNGTKETTDDRYYMTMSLSVMGESLNIEMWMQDGKMYSFNGTDRFVTDLGDEAFEQPDLDPVQMVTLLFKDIDKAVVEKDGDKSILNLQISKEGILQMYREVLEKTPDIEGIDEMLSTLEEGMNLVEFNDMKITVNKDGYIEHVYTSAAGELEGATLDIEVDLGIKDMNTAVIPDFDPALFTESTAMELPEFDEDPLEKDDAGEVELDDYTLEVTFDDGTGIRVHSPEEQGIYCYFDDEQQGLFFFDDEAILAQGMFLPLELGRQVYDEVLADTENYRILDEHKAGKNMTADVLSAVALNETDIMEKDTTFSICLFPEEDLGLVIFGDLTDEDYVALIKGIVFTEL
ncbi:MAG: hypothetical protein IIY47_04915 [Solobacterium sp.]|nr:hypothetical protein [Solobacterium sp.]